MSALAHLLVLGVLFVALRGRLLSTRVGGVVLGGAALFSVWTSWRSEAVRARLADPDLWPGVVFVAVGAVLAWWSLRREQRLTTPIHEDEAPSPLSRFLPLRPSVVGWVLVLATAAFVSAPLGLPPDLALGEGGQGVRSGLPASTLPWFLLGLAELSRHLGPLLVWILLPTASICALFAAPWLDTQRPEIEAPFRGRRDEVPFFLWAWLGLGLAPLAVALFTPMAITASGPVAAGPGPGPSAAVRPALAEWFWLDLLGRPEPTAWFVRELPGILLLLCVFVALPALLPRWSWTRGVFGRHLRRLGTRRYVALCLLLAIYTLVPLGLGARACGFGPLLRWPWFSLGGLGGAGWL